MKPLKSLTASTAHKGNREKRVLLALIEHHLNTGKPVGSASLKESALRDLSAATIRNYFAQLETKGLLTQQHASGGRLPTDRAYRTYAEEYRNSQGGLSRDDLTLCDQLRQSDSREIAMYLQKSAEKLSAQCQSAIFLSAPHFEQDYIVAIRLLAIDNARLLAIIITDFGVIKSEQLYLERKLTTFDLKRLEEYFHWRLTGLGKPEHLEKNEMQLAQEIYSELLLRFIVNYANFSDSDLYRTGFSRLLHHAEFQESSTFASGLAIFENSHTLRLLAKECMAHDDLLFWIGGDLEPHGIEAPNCSVIALPYRIGLHAVGVIGMLTPIRTAYRAQFSLLRAFSDAVSGALTRTIYKFKIKYRTAGKKAPALAYNEKFSIITQSPLLLENYSTEEME